MDVKLKFKDVYRTFTPKSSIKKLEEQIANRPKSLCQAVENLIFE